MAETDEEIDLSESSDGDFSASEDDWIPNNKDRPDTSSDEDDFEESPTKRSTSKILSRKNISQRGKPAKAIAESPRLKEKFKPTGMAKAIAKRLNLVESGDSDSSCDDYLVNPNEIDLNSDFFAAGTSKQHGSANFKEEPPKFDCNIGVLSDSDDDENDNINEEPCTSSKLLDFQGHQSFNKNLENVKEMLNNFKSSQFGREEHDVDITKLLAIGESSTKQTPVKESSAKMRKLKSTQANESDSDWEEVGERSQQPENVVVTVGPTIKPKIDRTQLELEASIKRKINRRKKEIQFQAHKVSVLCWIAHGNYVNQVLNHTQLMEMSLGFMPSKNCYPKDKTDQLYFEQIAKWYKSQVTLKNTQMWSKLSKVPALQLSLALQFKAKEAICKRDYVLMFIILLRAIGIQCRLVLNFVTIPIRPPQKELCSLKQIDETKKKPSTKDACKKVVATEILPEERSNSRKKKSDKASTSKSLTPAKSAKPDKTIHKDKSSPSTQSNPSPIRNEGKSLHVSLKRMHSPDKSFNSESDQVGSPIKSKSAVSSKKAIVTPTSKSSPIITNSAKQNQSSKIKVDAKSSRSLNLDKAVRMCDQTGKSMTIKEKLQRNKLNIEGGVNGMPSTSTKNSEKSKKSKDNVITSSPISKRTRRRDPINASKPSTSSTVSAITTSSNTRKRKNRENSNNIPQLDGGHELRPIKRKPNLSKLQNKTENEKTPDKKPTKYQGTDESDNDFVPIKKVAKSPSNLLSPNRADKKPQAKAVASQAKTSTKKVDRRVLSTDDECEIDRKKRGIDIWIEVYSEKDEKWLAMDIFKPKVNCVELLRGAATKPVSYVFAWNNNHSIRDVSSRYCTNWNTVTRKQRVSPEWLNKALQDYMEKPSVRSRIEELELNKIHLKEPLPTTISEYKDHPLYALKRHLLKFEGIYPPDALTLGFVRNEPVYARECVHTLHSREIWVKQARVVKPGETPYKIVKARPKWDRLTNKMLDPLPLEIFGYWQTQPYEPPTAENGIVPRNAYGNVELFKPEMLPKKTVHLQLPSLNRTCKKMKIDCAQAVVGFDFHSGASHPTFDGFVICEEFAEIVVAQWWEDQEEAQRKEEEKYNQRVYGNWKKLIKGLLIRRHLQRKYNFANEEKDDNGKRGQNFVLNATTTAGSSANIVKKPNRKRK